MSARTPPTPPPPERARGVPPAGLTPGGAELLPLFAALIDRWHRAQERVASWEDAVRELPATREGAAGLAERIQLINTFQWHEEDRSRDAGATDAVLAAVKKSIDASNARRVRAVEAFDAHVIGGLAAAGSLDPSAPLHSESPGSIVDRLTVLVLKVWHAREAAGRAAGAPAQGAAGPGVAPAAGATGPAGAGGRPIADEAAERLRSLEEQRDDLAGCLERLYADIAAGRARVKLYRQVKLYQDPVTGRARPEPD